MGEVTNYELLVLIHPEKDVERVVSSIKDLIKKHKGKVANVDNWGGRVLSYPIKKQTEGNYVLFMVEFSKEQLRLLGKALKLKDEILRHMIVKKNF